MVFRDIRIGFFSHILGSLLHRTKLPFSESNFFGPSPRAIRRIGTTGEWLPLLRIKLTCTCFLCSVPHADGDSRQRVSLSFLQQSKFTSMPNILGKLFWMTSVTCHTWCDHNTLCISASCIYCLVQHRILRPEEGLPFQLLLRVVFGCFGLSRMFVLLTLFVVIYTKDPYMLIKRVLHIRKRGTH